MGSSKTIRLVEYQANLKTNLKIFHIYEMLLMALIILRRSLSLRTLPLDNR